jgi:hypothetical protein
VVKNVSIVSILVAAVFGLFYAYDVWEAVSTLIALPAFYDAFGLDASYVPWWLLWAGVLLPPIVFVLALVIGRKQSELGKALVLLVGLAVVAGLGLSAIALEQVLRPELIAVL